MHLHYEWDSKKNYTEEEKIEAFKVLVKEAVVEQTENYPRRYKSPLAGPAFNGRGFQNDHLKTLLGALEQTEALLILGKIVLGDEDGR